MGLRETVRDAGWLRSFGQLWARTRGKNRGMEAVMQGKGLLAIPVLVLRSEVNDCLVLRGKAVVDPNKWHCLVRKPLETFSCATCLGVTA